MSLLNSSCNIVQSIQDKAIWSCIVTSEHPNTEEGHFFCSAVCLTPTETRNVCPVAMTVRSLPCSSFVLIHRIIPSILSPVLKFGMFVIDACIKNVHINSTSITYRVVGRVERQLGLVDSVKVPGEAPVLRSCHYPLLFNVIDFRKVANLDTI